MKPPRDKSLGEILSDPTAVSKRLVSSLSADTAPRAGEQVLREVAISYGEDPDKVLAAVQKDDPLARLVMKVLGIQPRRKTSGGRPEDTAGNFRAYDMVMALRAEGFKGEELWETARERLGAEISVESLQKSLRRTQKKHPIALAFSEHPPKRTKPR